MDKRKISIIGIGTAICVSLIMPASAQKASVSYAPSGTTNVPASEVTVTRGTGIRRPKNYDYYYYSKNYNPVPVAATAVTASAATAPIPHRVLGAVNPYSSLEYSDLILKMMNDDRAKRGEPLIGIETPSATTETVESAPTTIAMPAPAQDTVAASDQAGEKMQLEEATVTAIGDKGVLITADAGEIRLRGVGYPSVNTHDEARKKFADESLGALRDLVLGKTIFYVVDNPSKGLDGRTLATVHLSDGTLLNRLVLESGMAILNPGDFPDEPVADSLVAAQADAVKNARGIWAIWEKGTK